MGVNWNDEFSKTYQSMAVPLYGTFGDRSTEQYADYKKYTQPVADWATKLASGDYQQMVAGAAPELGILARQRQQADEQANLLPRGVAQDYAKMRAPQQWAAATGDLLAKQRQTALGTLAQLGESSANQGLQYGAGQANILQSLFGAIGQGQANQNASRGALYNFLGQVGGLASKVPWGEIFGGGPAVADVAGGAGAASAGTGLAELGGYGAGSITASGGAPLAGTEVIGETIPAGGAGGSGAAAGSGSLLTGASGAAIGGGIMAAPLVASKVMDWAFGTFDTHMEDAFKSGKLKIGDPAKAQDYVTIKDAPVDESYLSFYDQITRGKYWAILPRTGKPAAVTPQEYYQIYGQWPTGYTGQP